MAFSPDGSKLATASGDYSHSMCGEARLWDVATGKPLGESLQHERSVFSVAFSPNGSKLATAPDDETARLWDIDSTPAEPTERLVLWAATITGLIADSAGGVRVLTPEEMADYHARLEAAGGPPRAYLEALARRRAAP